jgi:hypothetical protein
MLAQLEKNPYRCFYQKELEVKFPDDFARAVQDKLVTRVPLQIREGVVGYYDYRLPRPYLVYCENGILEAYDDDDPEAGTLVLGRADLQQWSLDLTKMARRFQEVNGLTGTPECLEPHLWFLGEKEVEGTRFAYLLAFLNGAHSIPNLLGSLRVRMPATYRRFALVCPSYAPSLEEARQLEPAGITFFRLVPEDLFNFSAGTALEAVPAGPSTGLAFQYSEDYRWVKWRGQEFGLSEREADVVRLMHQTVKMGIMEVAWRQMQQRLGLQGIRLRDLFKRSGAWGTLIVPGSRKGLYRLNL